MSNVGLGFAGINAQIIIATEISPDDEVDIGGDDDLGVDTGETQTDV